VEKRWQESKRRERHKLSLFVVGSVGQALLCVFVVMCLLALIEKEASGRGAKIVVRSSKRRPAIKLGGGNMNHEPCNCGGPLSGEARYRVYAEYLNGCGGGVYGNGVTLEEAIERVKHEMRDHRQKLSESRIAVIDLTAHPSKDPVLLELNRPKRWAEIAQEVSNASSRS